MIRPLKTTTTPLLERLSGPGRHLVAIQWDESFRIIFSRYPFMGIYGCIADPDDIEAVIELERLTNDRIRDAAGDISLLPPHDRISGPGSTPIMAAFTHVRPSRFSDGSFGVYYAARVVETAIVETVYHVERFYQSASEPSADVDMRVYAARIAGMFDDLRSLGIIDTRLDPDSYAAPQPYARALRDKGDCDGIVFGTVREPKRRDRVACFRPRSITSSHPHGYFTYRWDGLQQRVIDTFHRESRAGPLSMLVFNARVPAPSYAPRCCQGMASRIQTRLRPRRP